MLKLQNLNSKDSKPSPKSSNTLFALEKTVDDMNMQFEKLNDGFIKVLNVHPFSYASFLLKF